MNPKISEFAFYGLVVGFGLFSLGILLNNSKLWVLSFFVLGYSSLVMTLNNTKEKREVKRYRRVLIK